jgi:hypothetical protein
LSNRPAPFKQIDVTRAAKGALAAGLSVARIVICDDKIIVYTTADEMNGSDEISKTLGMQ